MFLSNVQLEHNIKAYVKNLSEVFWFIHQFAVLGGKEVWTREPFFFLTHEWCTFIIDSSKKISSTSYHLKAFMSNWWAFTTFYYTMSVYLLLAGSFDALDESEQCVLVSFLVWCRKCLLSFPYLLEMIRYWEGCATLRVNQIRIVNITTDFPPNINSQSCRRLSV